MTKPIQSLLIANRGEIARRILRTCRALGIEGVAVYSDADRELPFVREADRAVRLGPPPVGESYLKVEAVLAAAARAGVDAVHPGYGFLSENAAFAEAVVQAGLTWVGPPAAAIRAMGDKAAARRLASGHGLPVVPGFDDPGASDAELTAAAGRVGYPLLVKAAAGGGGRGMRRVDGPEELAAALSSARREALSAFGSDAVLLERYVERPRHVEVQVLADAHGGAVHLFERECSIQRRHQKILEEAPSPAVDERLRAKMGEVALEVARLAGYVGAGTVEFLLDAQGSFYFLEMNTRLQVEHPVTELVTGLDLVALQLAVAEGKRLPFAQRELRLRGHAIEARLYAEDPLRDYLPSSGELVRFDLPLEEGVRVDAGYEGGSHVWVFYDPMLAKLIVWGEDRAQASRRLLRALRRAWVPGLATNLPLLREVLAHPAWNAGELDTHFLPRHGLPTAPPLNLAEGTIAAVALGWHERRASAPYPAQMQPGFRLGGTGVERDRFVSFDAELLAEWRTVGARELALRLVQGETLLGEHALEVLSREGDELAVVLDGVHQRWRVACRPAPGAAGVEDGTTVYVHLGHGEAMVTLVPRFPLPQLEVEPGSCVAPTPGKVVRIHVRPGQQVERGETLVTLEAMKMEHRVSAPEAGEVLSIAVEEGEQVEQGKVLLHLAPAEEG